MEPQAPFSDYKRERGKPRPGLLHSLLRTTLIGLLGECGEFFGRGIPCHFGGPFLLMPLTAFAVRSATRGVVEEAASPCSIAR